MMIDNQRRYKIKPKATGRQIQIAILQLKPLESLNNSSSSNNDSTNYRLKNHGFCTTRRTLKPRSSSIREANTKRKSIPEPTALA